MGDLFDKVKLAIQAQKGFCSRSTSVTPLGTIEPSDKIRYTDCEDSIKEIPYSEISDFNGYIDDCVKGGSPISSDNKAVKLFVQYGTTNCETPPPGSNLILISCSKQTPYVVSRGSISTTLTKGDIYYITFKDNVVENGCYEISEDTSDASVDTIQGEPQSFGVNGCLSCLNPPA
jgi:hypothetical protein